MYMKTLRRKRTRRKIRGGGEEAQLMERLRRATRGDNVVELKNAIKAGSIKDNDGDTAVSGDDLEAAKKRLQDLPGGLSYKIERLKTAMRGNNIPELYEALEEGSKKNEDDEMYLYPADQTDLDNNLNKAKQRLNEWVALQTRF